jgi:sulfofructose kinase
MSPSHAACLPLDVFCVGHASHDLILSVPHHPGVDEKMVAERLLGCGGGPSANAAIAVARLGLSAGWAGYLGRDFYGEAHLAEFQAGQVDTRWVVRGDAPTPLSVVLVKPDGQRALINHKGARVPLAADALDFSGLQCKVLLFDGHEPELSAPLLEHARIQQIPTVVDAGSLHPGTEYLMFRVDHLVCSEKFARQWLGRDNPAEALQALSERVATVVITLGERGLIWKRGGESGDLAAFPVEAVDTTGAGDAFHGAYAVGLARGDDWDTVLRRASAAGAWCCTRRGARPGMPHGEDLQQWLVSS